MPWKKKEKPRRVRPRLIATNSEGVRSLVEGATNYPARVVICKRKKKTIRNVEELKILLPFFEKLCREGYFLTVEPVRLAKTKRRRHS